MRLPLQAFGSDLTSEETHKLYQQADTDNNNLVTEQELAHGLAARYACLPSLRYQGHLVRLNRPGQIVCVVSRIPYKKSFKGLNSTTKSNISRCIDFPLVQITSQHSAVVDMCDKLLLHFKIVRAFLSRLPLLPYVYSLYRTMFQTSNI